MGLFKKLANYSRQYNSTSQSSGSRSSTGIRKVCVNCNWYSSYGPHGLYACVKHKINFSSEDVANRKTCDSWSKKWGL